MLFADAKPDFGRTQPRKIVVALFSSLEVIKIPAALHLCGMVSISVARRRTRAICAAAAGIFLLVPELGCQPNADNRPGGQAAAPEMPAPVGSESPAAVAATSAFVPGAGGLRRLTAEQFQSTIRDLLGEEIRLDELPPDTAGFGLLSVGAGRSSVSYRAAEQHEALAARLAKKLMTDPVRRRAFVGCEPTSVSDQTCAASFFRGFGARAFRRPLSELELGRYVNAASKAGAESRDAWLGLETALAAMLQSPKLIYRSELGEPDLEKPGFRKLTPYEVATRLSFLVLGRTPSVAMLSQAEGTTLSTASGVGAAAEALLKLPEAHSGLGTFFSELVDLHRLDGIRKDAATFPTLTPTLVAAMSEETRRLFEDVVFTRDADYLSLLDSDATFVNPELARFYGWPEPPAGDFVRVTIPASSPRRGLLGNASLLSIHAHQQETSPTRRGHFIRSAILCQEVPPPPPGVSTALPQAANGGGHLTKREQLASHATAGACKGCHSRMDPIGLALENFDAVGAFRETDQGAPIDTGGDLDGAQFSGPVELSKALRASPDAATCVVRMLYAYSTGHLPEDSELPSVEALSADFAVNEHRLQKTVLAMTKSDSFRYVSAPR